MKHNKKSFSIRWKIFIYLIGFTALLLALIWYFQIKHLNRFYKYIKKAELQKVAELLEEHVADENLKDYFDEAAREYDIIINLADSNGKTVCSSGITEMSHIYILNDSQFRELVKKAEEGGGTAMYEVDGRYKKPSENRPLGDQSMGEAKEGFREPLTDARSVVYIKKIVLENGDVNYLLISSLITPLDATVYTLRTQFVYISAIFIVLALIIALVISQIVAKPIVRINSSAKKLADGDFDTHFEGHGYREVQELSGTLNYAAGELGRSKQLQKDLIANVSHDLRTPLTMITAYAEVMRDIPGENNPENVQVIIDEATRLTTLVNDLLDLSKLQSGVNGISREVFDFTTNVMAVLQRFSKLTEQDGYSIRFEYRDNVKVYADEYKIYQVIYNLINNAINYAGDDKTVIVRQIVHGNIVRLEVEDHGQGIEENELDNIWDRYYKIDKTHRRAVQGTGLGLSIVQNILKLHNSKFGVHSTVGKGSVFWFELPTDIEETEENV